jgi:hypothetical protein
MSDGHCILFYRSASFTTPKLQNQMMQPNLLADYSTFSYALSAEQCVKSNSIVSSMSLLAKWSKHPNSSHPKIVSSVGACCINHPCQAIVQLCCCTQLYVLNICKANREGGQEHRTPASIHTHHMQYLQTALQASLLTVRPDVCMSEINTVACSTLIYGGACTPEGYTLAAQTTPLLY